MQRFRIEFGFNPLNMEQRFNLRRKRETIALVKVIERLDAEVIASDKQRRRSRAQIADRKRKHSTKPLDAIGAFLFVQMKDHFSVGMRNETVPLAFEFGAQTGKIVDLTVVRDPDRAVFVTHRHMAERRQVQDGETAASKPHVRSIRKSAIPHSRVIRSAMRLHARHPHHRFPVAAIDHTTNAAHWLERFLLSRCLNPQLVNLCLDMKKLYALQAAVNQSRNTIEKPESKDISVEKEQNRRRRKRKELLPQPPPPLSLRSKERWPKIARAVFSLKPHFRFPV